jgi:hypothetical protein
LKKNIKNFIDKINTFNFSVFEINFIFIVLYIFSLLILFTPFGDLFLSTNFPRKMNFNTGDSGSYINFSFENLKTVLSQHRSFGIPLILKIYMIFDEKLYYWPFFSFIIFIVANNFMLNTLINCSFGKIFSCVFSGLTFMSYNVWEYAFGWTEIIGISFLMFSISFLIISIIKNKLYAFLLLSFFIFFTIQIRPSFLLILIFPFIFSLYFLYINKYKKFLKLNIFSFMPIFFYILIKFIVTNSLGLTPFTGVQLSGHAGFYLDETTLVKMKDKDNIEFAKKFIKKKKNFSDPCNLDSLKIKEKNFIHRYCWNIYLMEAWLDMVRQENNITPFEPDSNKNFEAWKYTNLDHFFGKVKNNINIDKKLLKFSIEIIEINFKDHLVWSLNSIIQTLKTLFFHPAIKNIIIISLVFIVYFYFFGKKNEVEEIIFQKHIKLIFLFSIISFTIISLLLFGLMHIPNQRTAGVQFIFLVPAIFGYLTDSLNKKK